MDVRTIQRRLLTSLCATGALALGVAGCGGTDDEPETIAEGPVAAEDVPALDTGAAAEPSGLLRWKMTRLDGTKTDLSQFAGKVVLVVNTASECGFSPQFEELQGLYEERRDDGLVILGFPANDFEQEPRSDEEIATFCKANFGVEFPMFAKSAVTGPDANPLFAALPEPDYNFNKYLLDRKGELVANWGATTAPDDPDLTTAIDKQL
jgi:glutathione peroxidase